MKLRDLVDRIEVFGPQRRLGRAEGLGFRAWALAFMDHDDENDDDKNDDDDDDNDHDPDAHDDHDDDGDGDKKS